MAKKQWRVQADEFFERLMELLRLWEGVANLAQEPYKSDFFRVFSDAYRRDFCGTKYRIDEKRASPVPCKLQRPLICGDTIRDFARARGWIHSEMDPEWDRYQHIETVCTWWDEWTYAWDQPKPNRPYIRKQKS